MKIDTQLMANYSRRNFIKFNSVAAMAAFAVPTALGSCASKKEGQITGVNQTIAHIAGKNLQGLRDWYARELFERFLPNMDRYVVDHEYGGFMCEVDITTGESLSTKKRVWYEGRGVWTYSFLYNNLLKDEKLLEVAKKSLDFVMKHRPKAGKFWSSSYTKEGTVIGGVGDNNPRISKGGDIYGNLFVAEGLAEYAKAVNDSEYFVLAKEILLDSLRVYDDPNYQYSVTYLSADATEIRGVRVLGHWMVLLRAATQMLEFSPDSEIEVVANRCVEAIMDSHLNSQYALFNEALNHDFSLPNNEFNQFSYLGHGIETLWMVMFEAHRRKDDELLQRSAEAFKRHVTVAHDPVYGGYFRSLDHVDNHVLKTDKPLWLQEEVLIGTLFLIEHAGDEWATACFAQTYNYICEKFARPGFKFWIPKGDRMIGTFSTNRAEHYHHPRHLMLNLMALDRIIKKA